MSFRLRPTTRRRFSVPDEDRRTFLVNAAFVAIIAALVVLLIGALGWTYYENNLRPIASVGGVEIRPDMVTDRQELAELRIDRQKRRIRQAVVDGEIDQNTAALRDQQLDAELDELQAAAPENLIDLIFQERLANERGITVTDADVDARLVEELAGVERRAVQMIVIKPDAKNADAPTYREREAARQKAEQALAALQGGATFAEVVDQFDTDQTDAPGGELGVISSANPLDDTFRERLFELEQNELTDVVRGADGAYRIGRVTEIRPAAEERGYLNDVLEVVSRERLRQFLRWELIAERLRESVADEILGASTEQLRLSHIRIDTSEEEGDTGDEGEVHYSEILVAPGDDPETAPDLAEDDPAWDAARQEAEQIHQELQGIVDPVQRLERFRALAREKSDSAISAEDGGDAGFVGRDLLPEALAAKLFDEEHQPDTLIAPVRAENGYYVMWFHERRESAAQRLEDLKAALAEPNPDWPALVAEYSDDDQSNEEEGDIGWWTRAMLDQVDAELADKLYALPVDGISEAIELGNATHVFRVEEKTQREFDADQIFFLRTDAFELWYGDKKEQAEADGLIVRADEEDDPGTDVPTEEPE
jgi:parvulin-like peptidyl-prolyl isomerase